ncbi:hypothetical protein DPMN_095892 [Dreissena polymorpha]|uniref:UBC core domain-containing protein n=1 Tax=Dreissena polymorpha TaxID=45954 RepID=A0A9D4L7C3_DREPO|nr:hypothetical protein DPMN_095892 [Dreissena polymorpha]
MATTGKHQWYVYEDGCISVDEPVSSVTYHSSLNAIIVTTDEPGVKIYDVTSGSVLQKSDLSAAPGEKVQTTYLAEKNAMVFTNSQAVGVRKDLQGVLLIDTALQMPLSSQDKNVRLELPLAEASQLLKSIYGAELPCTDETAVVISELQKQISKVQEATKGNHKTAKWATVCLNVPCSALRTVCICLTTELKRLNVYTPGLSIASAVSHRLGYLSPSSSIETPVNGLVERSAMYSEAARHETFSKWPHMDYKWALPDPMAQAGFYHQPNMSGDDRALCFTCNVCLVCWEPTDEPWSEHERHSPSCPFVKGEHTQNVSLSVTYATQPALPHSSTGDRIACVGTTACEDYLATSTSHGNIVVWNLKHKLKKHCQFVLDVSETVVAMKTGLQVDRQPAGGRKSDSCAQMEDSLEAPGLQSCHSLGDEVDARVCAQGAVTFLVEENSKAKNNTGPEVAVHSSRQSLESLSSFTRPNEDVEVTSMCVVHISPSSETENPSKAVRSETCKKDIKSKVKKRPVQPTLICGVSLRCPKVQTNCDDRSRNDSSDVQLMNRVNESVSGDTTSQIITDSSLSRSESDSDLLEANTNFFPYLLVIAVKEDVQQKICKQASMDSLKPSTSLGNIVQSMSGGMMGGGPDWCMDGPMLDMYDDGSVQIVNVATGDKVLSPCSPTEGTSKLDEIAGESGSGQNVSFSDSAIKTRLSGQPAGQILQCVSLPSEFHRENLQVTSIQTSLDKGHLIVAVSPKQFRSSAQVVTSGAKQSDSSEASKSESSGDSFSPTCFPAFNFSSSVQDSKSSSSGETSSTDASYSSDGNTNTNSSSVSAEPYIKCPSNGCILIYKLKYNCDTNYASIDEEPVVVRSTEEAEKGVKSITVLPMEVCEHIEEDDSHGFHGYLHMPPSVTTARSLVGDMDLYGHIAVIFTSGSMKILSVCDLGLLAAVELESGERFVDVTYCSGIDRLCACTSYRKLYFYQLSEDLMDQTDSALEGDLTPTYELLDGPLAECSKSEEFWEQSPRASVSDLLAKQPLSLETLSQLHQLIQFENLMPRFTATVPPCWTEMHQEQQQRRHPQHLQHQGEATQYTRTWKLQPDSNSWDEHLFEIVLPRICCVGHVDMRFSLNPLCPITPNIQVTLLKQNINSIGRGQSRAEPRGVQASTPVDSKINFNIGTCPDDRAEGFTLGINNVQDPQFLEKHHAEIQCGPISLSDCLDLSGNGGLVSLSSPQLLMSKPRSFLLHIKGFPSKEQEMKHSEKAKEQKKKRPLVGEKKTLKGLLHSYSTSGSSTRLENLRGCDWLSEISITIRKTRKTSLHRERLQRNCMIEQTSFHQHLLSIVAFEDGHVLSGVSPDYIQNMCIDILSWVANIQMNDPDTRPANKCVITSIQPRLKSIIQACLIQGSRTTAHKCARLIALCMHYYKSAMNQDLIASFNHFLLEALLDCLPLLLCTYSACGMKWFFTLLNRVKVKDVTSVSKKCAELLNDISKHFQERATPAHALLKARYSLNGHPFESDMFDADLSDAVKQVIPGTAPMSSFTSSLSGTGSSMSGTTSSVNAGTGTLSAGQQIDDLDFWEIFNSSATERSPRNTVEYARNLVLGMLEVEPLHFTCHSTSDGTKMERLDSVGAGVGPSMLNAFGLEQTNTIGNLINFGESSGSTLTAFNPTHMMPHYPMVSQQPAMAAALAAAKQFDQSLGSKSYSLIKNKVLTQQSTLDNLMSNAMFPGAHKYLGSNSTEFMPSTPKTTPQVPTPPLTPPNEAWQQIFMSGDKSETAKAGPTLAAPPSSHLSLQPPPPQVLIIDRIYSGARRFVILDFGKPILLTDVAIPMCSDLASLSVDVWVRGEETDGHRLVVAADIGYRSLIMNNIMPAPVCRYLKITTIGRYGSGTTRSKIPIGAFYGHSYILPWEQPSREVGPGVGHPDIPTSSQLQAQLSSFISLFEDIQCRYSLAKARLGGLVQQVEVQQYSHQHTQYYMKKTKNNEEDNNIIQPTRNKHNPRLRYGQKLSTQWLCRVFTRHIAEAHGINPCNDAKSVLTLCTFAE